MKRPPEKLHLQWHGDAEPEPGEVDAGDVTWAADRVFAGDVQYIRADLVRELHQAAGQRMITDDPTREQRLRLLEAWGKIGETL